MLLAPSGTKAGGSVPPRVGSVKRSNKRLCAPPGVPGALSVTLDALLLARPPGAQEPGGDVASPRIPGRGIAVPATRALVGGNRPIDRACSEGRRTRCSPTSRVVAWANRLFSADWVQGRAIVAAPGRIGSGSNLQEAEGMGSEERQDRYAGGGISRRRLLEMGAQGMAALAGVDALAALASSPARAATASVGNLASLPGGKPVRG